jgi:hypothetical protein
MKGKRRQDLKTNDLAEAIEGLTEWLRQWGAYVVGGVAAVIIVLVVVSYMRTAASAELSANFAELTAASIYAPDGSRKSDAEISKVFSRLREIGEQAGGDSLGAEAMLRRGVMALDLAMSGTNGIATDYADQARKAFEELATRFPDRPAYSAFARLKLAQLEVDTFLVDGSIQHKEAAQRYLQAVRDDARVTGTPLQSVAVERLNALDKTFQRIEFPKQPPPATRPTTAPASPASVEAVPPDAPPAPPSGPPPADSGAGNTEPRPE